MERRRAPVDRELLIKILREKNNRHYAHLITDEDTYTNMRYRHARDDYNDKLYKMSDEELLDSTTYYNKIKPTSKLNRYYLTHLDYVELFAETTLSKEATENNVMHHKRSYEELEHYKRGTIVRLTDTLYVSSDCIMATLTDPFGSINVLLDKHIDFTRFEQYKGKMILAVIGYTSLYGKYYLDNYEPARYQ